MSNAGFTAYCKFLERSLPKVYKSHGHALFSPPRTVAPYPVLILGTNPGGDGQATVAENLGRRKEHPEAHGYAADKTLRMPPLKGQPPPRESTLQKVLTELMRALDLKIENVPATNIVFKHSKSTNQLRLPEDADECWPAIDFLLNIVRPKLIVAFGNSGTSSYTYLREHKASTPVHLEFPIRNPGNLRSEFVRRFVWERERGHSVLVFGIPHPSRFNGDNLVEQMSAYLQGTFEIAKQLP
jgi:uracil-DNA glycosylase